MIKHYPITPVPAPRQVRSDKWNPGPMVLRYRAFRDEVRYQRVKFGDGATITFHMPMPPSWSLKKRHRHAGKPHQIRPDIDNLYKALSDAVHAEDSHISRVTIIKVWDWEGGITIEEAEK